MAAPKKTSKEAALKAQTAEFGASGDGAAGGMTHEELAAREARLASASRGGAEMLHPGDFGDGDGATRGMPLSALTRDMASALDFPSRSLLSDPSVVGIVSNDAESLVGEVRTSDSVLGLATNELRSLSPAQQARQMTQKPQSSHVLPAEDDDFNEEPPPPPPAHMVPQGQPKPPARGSLPAAPVAANRDGMVDYLLARNHELRRALDEMARRHGEKPSFVDARLADLQADNDLDPDEIKKLVQIVLVETHDGTRSHAVILNGVQVNASAFSVKVDTEEGVFEVDVNLRKGLF